MDITAINRFVVQSLSPGIISVVGLTAVTTYIIQRRTEKINFHQRVAAYKMQLAMEIEFLETLIENLRVAYKKSSTVSHPFFPQKHVEICIDQAKSVSDHLRESWLLAPRSAWGKLKLESRKPDKDLLKFPRELVKEIGDDRLKLLKILELERNLSDLYGVQQDFNYRKHNHKEWTKDEETRLKDEWKNGQKRQDRYYDDLTSILDTLRSFTKTLRH